MARHSSRLGRGLAAALVIVLATHAGPVDTRSYPARLDASADAAAAEPMVILARGGDVERLISLLRDAGAEDLQRLDVVGGVAARVPVTRLSALAADRAVAALVPDEAVALADGWTQDDFETDDQSQPGWTNVSLGATAIGAGVTAGAGWASGMAAPLTGRGVAVAIVDSGIAPHPDLAGRVVARVDFVGDGAALADPGGHGTHVAGLVAGTRTGAAPGAQLVDVRVFSADGTSTLSKVIRGIQWTIANRAAYGIRVLNLSLGQRSSRGYHVDPLAAAVEAAHFSGIAVVAAAGNNGPAASTVTMPGGDPFVITVGAFDDRGTYLRSDDFVPLFSGRGPTVDGFVKPLITAPGRKLVSLRAAGSALDLRFPERRALSAEGSWGARTFQGYRGYMWGTGTSGEPRYFRLSGTSMATGLVSGVAALLLEGEPALRPSELKARLIGTARTIAGGAAVDAATAKIATGTGVADAGVPPSKLLLQLLASQLGELAGLENVTWENITWENITWENITWENITWENITWESITWESITWESISWESAGGRSAEAPWSTGGFAGLMDR